MAKPKNPKLAEFGDLVKSDVPAEKIAEIAGVSVADVQRERESESPATPPPEPTPAPAEPDPQSDWVARAEAQLNERAELLEAWDRDLQRRELVLAKHLAQAGIKPHEADMVLPLGGPPVDRGPAPPCVRATSKARILDANGRLWYVRTRDVYTGEQAAFLWERHPHLVEAFTPKG